MQIKYQDICKGESADPGTPENLILKEVHVVVEHNEMNFVELPYT